MKIISLSHVNKERTIIICLATSPHGAVVAKEGLRFAQLLEAKPIFLNVGIDDENRRKALSAIIQGARGAEGGPIELLVRPGDPYSIISIAAAELQTEMIVMGALNRDPALVRVWGSVARKIARRAACSVLLLSSASAHRPGDRIVAAIELDGRSSQTMPMILQIARQGQSESIHFVREFSQNSTSVDEETSDYPITNEDYTLARQRSEQRRLADFLSAYELEGLNIRIAALPGREGMQVVDYARQQRADLVILPAPPRRLNFWDRFFRHPLETVLLDLPCDLLLQRPSKNNTWARAPLSNTSAANH